MGFTIGSGCGGGGVGLGLGGGINGGFRVKVFLTGFMTIFDVNDGETVLVFLLRVLFCEIAGGVLKK